MKRDSSSDRRLPHWRRDDRWMCVDGTVGHRPPDRLLPLDGELVVHKTGFNAFANAELDAFLRRNNCDAVIMAGLHLHACVRSAAVECLDRGCHVHVAEDAVATNDPIHAAATRRWLAERCVVFESTASLLARLDGGQPTNFIHRSPHLADRVLFEITPAGAQEVATAAAAARNALPAWRRTSWSERQRLLENVASRIEAVAPDLARQMAVEIGKPLLHGMEEVRRAVANVRDTIARAVPIRSTRKAPGSVRYPPVGVVAIISPWNNPVAIPLGKIAPAFAFGNTVVWKPSPAAAGVSRALLKILYDAGAPVEGTQLLEGDQSTARCLAGDPNVDAVTLTGSLMAGCAVQEICARRIIPLQAELSGNNAAIVWDDVDLADTAAQVAWGAFAFAGQRCTANRRVIVPEAYCHEFLREVKTAAERLPWGNPLDAGIEIGPVITTAKRDEVAALVAGAETSGHKVVRLHQETARQPWIKAGAYAQPAVIVCDQPADSLVQEETMGPLLVVQPARDFSHALNLCNGVRHGLAASLFTRSTARQQEFLETAHAGVLKLNATTAGVDATLPFGGWKASGIGPPEHGEADRLFYTRTQAVYGAHDEIE